MKLLNNLKLYISLTPLSFVLLLPLLLSCQSEKQEQSQYNVIFIAIDDLRTELNCYGADHIKSPNIDLLAANGVRFSNAHVQQAICMASRASILTGVRPEKSGIYTGESVTDVLPDILTMNKFFQQNGYNIASLGKIYHYDKDTKNQFGKDHIAPRETWQGLGYVTPDGIAKMKKTSKKGRGPAYESADVHDTIYPDGLNTLNAIRKLEMLKNDDKPFFLSLGLTKPHLPFNAPQKYWDMYPEESIKLSSLTDRPKNTSRFTVRPGGELSNYYNMPELFENIPDSTAVTLRRGYYACVSYADTQVGHLLSKLKELKLDKNTIVVLWGDHGYKLGDYNSWCKWSNMNIDTNVPFIIKVPNGKKGIVVEQPVETLDLYPTLAALCNLEPPSHLEGKSLVETMTRSGEKTTDKLYAYSVWPDNRWVYDKTVMGYSVTDNRFNYVEWVQLKTGEVLERELYDHKMDPLETKNVVSDTQYKEVIQQLAGKIKVKKENTDHNHKFKKLR